MASANLMMPIVLISLVSLIAIVVAVVLIPYNLKRKHIIRCAKSATNEQLEAIYSNIERLGSVQSTCAALARTNSRSGLDDDWKIPVPHYVETWGGRSIVLKEPEKEAFEFSPDKANEAVLNGCVYRLVPIPRNLTKSGKARNQYSPTKYVAANPDLLKALGAVCPKYPAELLSFLFNPGIETFEFDSTFQARVGGSASWVQDAEFPNCPLCKKRMVTIMQIPGELMPGKLRDGMFYFFGCAKHQGEAQTVVQFT